MEWWTGNRKKPGDKVKLYRFLNLNEEGLAYLQEKGLIPLGMYQNKCSFDELIEKIKKPGKDKYDEEEKGYYRKQLNIYEGYKNLDWSSNSSLYSLIFSKIINLADASATSMAPVSYEMMQYLTTDPDPSFLNRRGYRLTLELDIKDVWRSGALIIASHPEESLFYEPSQERIINDNFHPEGKYEFIGSGMDEGEWVIFGPIPLENIIEVKKLDHSKFWRT